MRGFYNIEKRLLAIALSLVVFVAGYSQSILKSPSTRSATVGLVVKDLATDSLLIVHNYDKSITPASVMKSVTTASAMLRLPADFRFATEVAFTGKLKKGVLDGNILVKASGDPTIESRHFPENAGFVDSIVATAKRLNIKSITGKIIVDRSVYDDGGVSQYWLLEDLAWDYGTGHYPFNYRDNDFKLTIGNGGFSSEPKLDYITVKNQLKKGKRNNVNLTRAEGSFDFYLKGCAASPNAKRTYNCANPDPSLLFESELKAMLKKEGISLEGADKHSNKEVAKYVHYSPVIDDVMHSLMVRSDNMFAEGMLRAAPIDDEEITVEMSSMHEVELWDSLGVDVSGISIMDGSGLARTDKLTPHFESDMLTYMARSEYAERYVNLFARVGLEGTLKSILKDSRLQGKLALKSGSMRGVQCYAGYKLDDDNRPTHVIVILINNFSGGRADLKTAIGRYLLETFPETPQPEEVTPNE